MPSVITEHPDERTPLTRYRDAVLHALGQADITVASSFLQDGTDPSIGIDLKPSDGVTRAIGWNAVHGWLAALFPKHGFAGGPARIGFEQVSTPAELAKNVRRWIDGQDLVVPPPPESRYRRTTRAELHRELGFWLPDATRDDQWVKAYLESVAEALQAHGRRVERLTYTPGEFATAAIALANISECGPATELLWEEEIGWAISCRDRSGSSEVVGLEIHYMADPSTLINLVAAVAEGGTEAAKRFPETEDDGTCDLCGAPYAESGVSGIDGFCSETCRAVSPMYADDV